jgi:hypothetical protein
MKTMKILLPVAALFISALAFGQKNGNSRHKEEKSYQSGSVKRAEARANGSVQANAHANENAQRNANENSVLNGTGTVRTKYKAKTLRLNGNTTEKRRK